MLGFELTLAGKATFGDLVRGDTALPMVSGRYGLGWTASHGGFETTNGGMTWAAVAVPEPIKPLREVTSRACGPVGCSAAGWLRIGWGNPLVVQSPSAPPSRPSPSRPTASLALDCDAGEPFKAKPARANGGDALGAAPSAATSKDTRMLTFDTSDTLGRAPRSGPLARVYAWGPKSGEWERVGAKVGRALGLAVRWTVRRSVERRRRGAAPGARRGEEQPDEREPAAPDDHRVRRRHLSRSPRRAQKPQRRADALRARSGAGSGRDQAGGR